METIAKFSSEQVQNLPGRRGYLLTVRDLLALPTMSGAKIVAGASGLDEAVRWVNVMEVPDILPWVKPNELLLTTGFSLRHTGGGQSFDPAALSDLIDGLADRGASALGFKTGRYLEELPVDMVEAAERRGFPILALPRGIAFDEVMSEVFTQLVDGQSWALDVADRLHRALTTIVLRGGDLPEIAGKFAELFGTLVLVCSPDGRVQAEVGEDAAIEALGALSLFDESGRFRTERVHPGLQNAPDGHGGQIAVAQVMAGDAEHGLIVAFGPDGHLGPIVVQALERAATVAALAITKQLAVSAVESKFRGDFLRDALEGVAGPVDQVVDHCGQLGWDVARPIAVIVVELDEVPEAPVPAAKAGRTPLDRLTAAWQQVVHARDRAAPVVGYRQEIVAIVPASTQTVERFVAELVAAVTGDRGGGRRSFSTGVSRVIDSVADLPSAYEQAHKAVVVGLRMRGPGHVTHFDSLGVHRLLCLVSEPAELRSFATEVLGPLAADSTEAVDLRHTLQELLDANCNVAESARSLHFHYNTLRYRISKLESILGPFTEDANLRLDIALALRVVQMRGF